MLSTSLNVVLASMNGPSMYCFHPSKTYPNKAACGSWPTGWLNAIPISKSREPIVTDTT